MYVNMFLSGHFFALDSYSSLNKNWEFIHQDISTIYVFSVILIFDFELKTVLI